MNNRNKKVAIIHFQPLEYYPPITNLINYIAGKHIEDFSYVKVFSCNNVKGRNKYQVLSIKYQDNGGESKRKPNSILNIHHSSFIIKRSPFPKENDNGIVRLLKYLHFNLFTLIGLITFRPIILLYYESYSVWPAFVYTRYFNRKCRIFIHNHEYESKKEYEDMMKSVKYYHTLEKKWLYPRAQWISQTNANRLHFFHQDHPTIKPEQLKIMPNYPPKEWKIKGERLKVQGTRYKVHDEMHENTKPLTLVYVGSLSFQSTYLKELCEWVLSQNGQVQFDVYAYNLYEDVKTYLKELNAPWVNYYEQGVEYNEQPHLLAQYDVGLILYKAHNQNYTHNAPNKLFEYLACDLDVWYPDVLMGPKPYNTESTYPKVLPIDFEHLENFDWKKAINKYECEYKPLEFFCEEIYKELVDEIVRK